MSSPSPASETKRTLLTLPGELVDNVFDRLPQSSLLSLLVVSHSSLSLSLPVLFRYPIISTNTAQPYTHPQCINRRVRRFFEALKRDPERFALVRELTVQLNPTETCLAGDCSQQRSHTAAETAEGALATLESNRHLFVRLKKISIGPQFGFGFSLCDVVDSVWNLPVLTDLGVTGLHPRLDDKRTLLQGHGFMPHLRRLSIASDAWPSFGQLRQIWSLSAGGLKVLRVSCGWAYTKDANIEGTAWAFGEMKGLQEVGIRWNDWHGEMVAAVCASMPSSVRRFEISIRNCHSDWAIDAESRLTPLTILSLPDHLPTTFADGFIAALDNRAHVLPNLERVSLKRMESSQTVELVLGQDVLYRPDDPARVRRCLFGLGFRIARERPTTNGRYGTVTEDWEWAPPLLEVSGFAVVEMFVGKGADVP